ncbi:uncharacterized protein EV422DRAFT_494673 [Fimicolochytrium jonesii]|uniref:uncharacterized protein n=1 Tax=Fimicolochytrium jonesii TaxID=1396493 RepID=UPI0022FE4BC1|nr:uncharacterized protein EV422DRAFT_494673 [Fimicolochytrium jonesii]KAI8822613.1 hypothetical protein EV422DRAFT_494673 [Fimicolochytrium jonesii]
MLITGLVVGLVLGLRKRDTHGVSQGPGTLQPYPGLSSALGTPKLVANGLSGIRALVFDSATGNLLAFARDPQQVVAIAVAAPSKADNSKTVLLDVSSANLGLNHGFAVHDGYMYASSVTDVYRWKYTNGTIAAPDARENIVRNIDSGIQLGTPGATATGHVTRSVVLDGSFMYVSVGSEANVDTSSQRARVRRFPYRTYTGTPFDFQQGQIWADGVRNCIAMNFDAGGKLWGAVTGPDDLQRTDLTADLHQDSPVENVYLFDQPRFYGYPFCFPAGNLTGTFADSPTVGKMYAWPDSLNDGTHTDAWCQSPANVKPPDAAISAHSTPIDLEFQPSTGDMLISLRGSWNRDIPSGYAVVRLPFSAPGGTPKVDRVTDRLLWNDNQLRCPSGCFRPTGIALVGNSTLYVASDVTGDIVKISV